MMQLLLGRGGGNSRSKSLVEFKAGRMNFDGRMVTPDRRRGLIRIIEDSTGMKIFQFCDAETKNPIDSETVYVFPGEAKFEKVKQTTDRVYLLEISGGVQRKFFWMQVSRRLTDFCRKRTRKRTRSGLSKCTTRSTTSLSRRHRKQQGKHRRECFIDLIKPFFVAFLLFFTMISLDLVSQLSRCNRCSRHSNRSSSGPLRRSLNKSSTCSSIFR